MKTKPTKPGSLDVLDELSHHAALHEARRGESTAADRAWSREVGDLLEARLAELRRRLTPEDAPPEQAPPIPRRLFELGRDALLARITAITSAMGGTVQYAHRNLKGLSDDDLRRLLATLDPTLRA
jgi:hypothetical protein